MKKYYFGSTTRETQVLDFKDDSDRNEKSIWTIAHFVKTKVIMSPGYFSISN